MTNRALGPGAVITVLPPPPKRDAEGFVLPHNLEAEKAVLGASMVAVKAADYIVDNLTPGAFFRRAHRAIFEAVVALRDRKSEVDLVTLIAQLGRVGQADDVGGPAYIAALADGLPRSSNVAHYAGILRDLQVKRAVADYGNHVLDLVASGAHGAGAILIDVDRRLMELQAGHVEGRMQTLGESHHALSEDLEWRIAHKGQLTGVETGFQTINEQTLGWQRGELIIIAARPSIGKTAFAVNSAVAAAVAKRQVAIFSLEMRRQQLEYRILSQLSAIPLSRLLTGYILEGDFPKLAEARCVMAELPLSIDDRSGQSAPDIRAACRQLKAEQGLDLVVVDYVQLMPGTLDRRGANRNEEVTDISRRLKHLADEIAVPVLAISQLTREGDKRSDPRPKLTDLRESGALEQDADLVCFLHRKHHREGGATSFILEKQRNGPTGTVTLDLDRETVTFTDKGEELPPPAPDPKAAEESKPPKFWQRGKRS